MTADMMLAVAAQLVSCTAAVWVLTEILGRATGWNKIYVALVLGPLLGVGAFATGFLSALPECPSVFPGCSWVAAGFAGLITTLVAKGFHDLIGDRLIKLLPEPPPGPGGDA